MSTRIQTVELMACCYEIAYCQSKVRKDNLHFIFIHTIL